MATANIKAVITAEDRASKEIEGFGSRVGAVGRNIAVVAAAAGAALVGLGVSSVKAFSAQEDAMARLQAGINNVRSASDKNISALTEQASALQKVTRFSDEQIISGQAMLTTFQLNQQTIKQLTPSMLNMAEAMRRSTGETMDLEQVSLLMGKVMGNAEGGIDGMASALRRSGVVMTEAQKQIFSTGTEAQRTATLVQIMSENFGGFAEAGGATFSGRLDIMKNQLGELSERLGEVLANKLGPFIDRITVWVETHPGEIEHAIQTLLQMITVIGNVFEYVGGIIQGTINNLTRLILVFWSVFDAAKAVGGAIMGFFSGIPGAIAAYFTHLPGMIIRAIGDVGGKIRDFVGDIDIPGPLGRVRDVIPGFAAGVRNFSGGMAVVGERGPELVNLPAGSDVIPNNQLGGGVTININNPIVTSSGVEARRFAQSIWRNLQDTQSAQGRM